jgi:hypothetical protein
MTRINRETETRAHEMRDVQYMEYVNPLSVPYGVAKEGYVYHWARRDVKGQPDYRVETLAQKGWTLVPADRAVHKTHDPLGRDPLAAKWICYKDNILMERPAEMSKREKAMQEQRSIEKMRMIRGVQNDPINNRIMSF